MKTRVLSRLFASATTLMGVAFVLEAGRKW